VSNLALQIFATNIYHKISLVTQPAIEATAVSTALIAGLTGRLSLDIKTGK
jgi:hypothetical protein